jgi:hypothetical protein
MTNELAVVFQAIRSAGLAVSARGERVRLEPAERVTPEVLELVRQHKPALLAALKAEAAAGVKGREDALSPGSVPARPDDGCDLPPPLGEKTTALLDALAAAGCRPDAMPDGQTFVAACPRCRRPGALRIVEVDGSPAVSVLCCCDEAALLELEGLAVRPLPPRWRERPKRPAATAADGDGATAALGPADTTAPGLAGERTLKAGAAGQAGGWPSWAADYHTRLVRAGCEPRIIVARGAGRKPILAIEATCPACRTPKALSAWPWAIGMMFTRCGRGCSARAIGDALAASPRS